MTHETARFAIYFTPRKRSALRNFGERWLGRDAASGAAVERLALAGVPQQRLAALVAEPARYGWHATLKAPFRLAPGRSAGELAAFLMAFAAQRLPFEAPPLALGSLRGFLALLPRSQPPLLSGLAEDCVRAFEEFRAKPGRSASAAPELAALTPAQEAMRKRWGYPYVMREFRFHLTLTARLDAGELAELVESLAPLVAPYCRHAVPIDGVSLFVEPAPGEPFRELRRFPFEGAG